MDIYNSFYTKVSEITRERQQSATWALLESQCSICENSYFFVDKEIGKFN